MDIHLEIAELACQIKTENLRWHKFLSKKYEAFIIKNKPSKSTDFILYLKIHKSRRKIATSLSKKEGVFIVKFFPPDNLRLFKNWFNWGFKINFGRLLLEKRGFLIHGSCFLRNRKAYIFAGGDRSGKSTILKLFPEYKGVSDDSCILRMAKNRFFVFGSPFFEKNQTERKPIKVPIGRLFFISQSEKDELINLSDSQATKLLMRNIKTNFLPGETRMQLNSKIFDLATMFLKKNRCSKLLFTKSRKLIKFLK